MKTCTKCEQELVKGLTEDLIIALVESIKEELS